MALELKQSLKLTQQLVMTPQLQQPSNCCNYPGSSWRRRLARNWKKIRFWILGLSSEEPEERNALDRTQEEPQKPENEISEVKVQEQIREDMDWENFLGEYSSTSSAPNMFEAPEETPSYENFVSAKTSLSDHLLWQWRLQETTEV